MSAESTELHETTVSERVIHRGKIIDVLERTVTLPNGSPATRDIVYHPGAVCVLAEPVPGHVLLVEQFRSAAGETLLELPAGKLDPGEPPMVCAVRELEEETGWVAETCEEVYTFYTSPGFANEVLSLFVARNLTKGEVQLDEDEFLNVHNLSMADVRHKLEQGLIRDAKTLVGLLWWLHQTQQGGLNTK